MEKLGASTVYKILCQQGLNAFIRPACGLVTTSLLRAKMSLYPMYMHTTMFLSEREKIRSVEVRVALIVLVHVFFFFFCGFMHVCILSYAVSNGKLAITC